jgi:hypothetical protein
MVWRACIHVRIRKCLATFLCLSVTMLYITITILNIIQRPRFNLKHAMGNIRTSQETHYASATNPTG